MRARIPFVVAFAVALSAAAPVWGFEVKKSRDGTPLRWAGEPIVVQLVLDDAPIILDPAAVETAVKSAFAVWNAALPEPVVIEVIRADKARPGIHADDRVNTIRWVKEGWDDRYSKGALASTLTTYDPDTGQITDTDIVINAEAYPWWAGADLDGCDAAYDLENVLTHEAGHFLGLAHETQVLTATMFPSTGRCAGDKRELDPDDLAGIAYLYDELGPVIPAGLACGVSVGAPRGRDGVPFVGLAAAVGVVGLRRGRRARRQGRGPLAGRDAAA